MRKLLLVAAANVFFLLSAKSQLLSWTPSFPLDNSTIVITMDATKGNQGLKDYVNPNDVYVHVGVLTNLSTGPTDWKYVKTTWATTDVIAKAISLGGNKYQYTINDIRTFFGVPFGETIKTINILFRNGAGTTVQRNSDASDMYIPVYPAGQLAVRIDTPLRDSRFIPVPETITKVIGDNISVKAVSSQSADINLKFNGTLFQTATGVTGLPGTSGNIIASGNQQIIAEAIVGAITVRDTINFFVAAPSNQAALPSNVRDGINYITQDSVVLVLFAPGKSRVSIIGDFNNWTEQAAYQMNITPDGRRYWLGVGQLTPGQEYAFQYLVNGTLRIGDPYCEKVLDPDDDPSIGATYPNLKSYPTGLTSGNVSILQTNKPAYNWQVTNFSRPDKRKMVIYELLVRDFVANHDWKTLRDTLSYLKNLGVNAIELMPINEFEGNLSWGYNPSYYLAADKYYGPENDLKIFIDSCHKKGIAVIMDIAMNHSCGESPLVQLYWDAINNRPATDNPWYNPVAKHAFNVCYDFNHQSDSTKYFLDRVVEHWLTNYKIDGFRWDLSKGFTQTQTCDANGANCNVGAWSNYDQSRIDIWNRIYNKMQTVAPGTYCILEHFADNSEEVVLSNNDMLLWGNANYNYNQATMGFSTGWDFGGASIYTFRGWTKPGLVAYKESHDEERTMYKNLQFGNSSGAYNVKDLATALRREEMAASFNMMTPGPRMIWQFEELGYDISIDFNGRTGNKPIKWDYFTDPNRKKLYNVFSGLIALRNQYSNPFINGVINASLGAGFKTLQVTHADLKITVIGNFDVVPQTANVTFQSSGTWYSYLTGESFNATGGSQSITLQPGEYYVYLDRVVAGGIVTSVRDIILSNRDFMVSLYPNPVQQHSTVAYSLPESGKVSIAVISFAGQTIGVVNRGFQIKGMQKFILNSNNFASVRLIPGNYLLQVRVNNKVRMEKFVVQR
ncbi:MAG: alpha-amylase family glycosyl hydrolase [Sphingobacteriales bacterium]